MTTTIYREDLPLECIEDCSSQGSVDEAVAYWAEDARVAPILAAIPAATLRAHCEDTGAWEGAELDDEDANRRRVLWLACCDFNEWDGTDESPSGADIYCVE